MWPELCVGCPSCHGVGYHAFELRVFEARTVPGMDGSAVDVSRVDDPPPGTPVIDRVCRFCGHWWTTVR